MLFARVDIDVTEFPTKTTEKEEFFWEGSEIIFFSEVGVRIPFSVGNFHFFPPEKLTFLGGVGGITSKLASK